MKFIYPAVFHKQEDGSVHAYFPDLACCEITAPDMEDAIEKANEACYNWIDLELQEDEPKMPPVSEPEDIPLKEGDEVRNISVLMRFYDGWDE